MGRDRGIRDSRDELVLGMETADTGSQADKSKSASIQLMVESLLHFVPHYVCNNVLCINRLMILITLY